MGLAPVLAVVVLCVNIFATSAYLYGNLYPIDVDINAYQAKTGAWFTPTKGEPWPMPQQYKVYYDQTYQIDQTNFHFVYTQSHCSILKNAVSRYHQLLFSNEKVLQNEDESTKNRITSLHIVVSNITDCNNYPGPKMIEDYTLELKSQSEFLLSATEVWGALRGLETFSQLIYQDNNKMSIRNVSISDWPRFSYRGIMLDSARHYLSISKIKETLSIMEHNKFNVFHWHIVDDQSFPYQSHVLPAFSEKGSFDPKKAIYTISDIKDIIEFAKDRGIRVIPEFDTPGHTSSWYKAYPEIGVNCSADSPNGDVHGILNPIDPLTYKYIKELFREVGQVFPDEYFHVGGDEVEIACWLKHPELGTLLQSEAQELESQFVRKIVNMVRSEPIRKKAILWQDAMEFNKDIGNGPGIVHVWKDNSWSAIDVPQAAKKGFDILYSACWYLNYIDYGGDWSSYYTCDPENMLDYSPVLGGQACIWSEFVDDTNLTPRLWPRASAVAERLWSDKNLLSVRRAAYRLAEHRCRLVKRGYPAQPITGAGYCH